MKTENNAPISKSLEYRIMDIIRRENLIGVIAEEGVLHSVILMAIAEEAELINKLKTCQEVQRAAKRYIQIKMLNICV